MRLKGAAVESAVIQYLRDGGPTPFAVHALGPPGAPRAAALEEIYQKVGAPPGWWWETAPLRLWWGRGEPCE